MWLFHQITHKETSDGFREEAYILIWILFAQYLIKNHQEFLSFDLRYQHYIPILDFTLRYFIILHLLNFEEVFKRLENVFSIKSLHHDLTTHQHYHFHFLRFSYPFPHHFLLRHFINQGYLHHFSLQINHLRHLQTISIHSINHLEKINLALNRFQLPGLLLTYHCHLNHLNYHLLIIQAILFHCMANFSWTSLDGKIMLESFAL